MSKRKAEKVSLEAQVADAEAAAQQGQSFSDFASVQQARQATVTALAESRFDWERVLRQLAIVIPNDVWITSLNATVSADAASALSTSSPTSGGSAGSGASDSITGPSLEIQGCAGGHEAVADSLPSSMTSTASPGRPSRARSARIGSSAAGAATASAGASSR